MRATLQSEINGDWERAPARPPVDADDGFYRYVPVPPVGRDEDGYPIEDGMSQTINHQVQTARWQTVLQSRYPAATVASDLTMPYKRGDTTKVLVPDLLVALRAERRKDRRSYRLWENPLPDLVMEMLSKSNSDADVGSKWRTYEHIGVREYFLFDPEGFELSTPLAGYRLQGKRYRPVRANTAGRLPSRVLGLELHVQGDELRFRDPETGEDLRTHDEEKARGDKQEARADVEKARADEAEVGRAAAEEGRAAAEEGRAAEKRRADEEKARADAAERELVRLKLLIVDKGGEGAG